MSTENGRQLASTNHSNESMGALALPIELLESSFAAIAPCGEAFVTAFYERLFTRFPQTRAFFASTDMKEQRKHLLGALALVIQHLRKPEVLTSALQGLGRRHVTYGIGAEHYPLVGTVLLETFADFLGERWTPAYQDAWEQAYEAVSKIMLEGANVAMAV
jgi:nitric oxide dioxygenase